MLMMSIITFSKNYSIDTDPIKDIEVYLDNNGITRYGITKEQVDIIHQEYNQTQKNKKLVKAYVKKVEKLKKDIEQYDSWLDDSEHEYDECHRLSIRKDSLISNQLKEIAKLKKALLDASKIDKKNTEVEIKTVEIDKTNYHLQNQLEEKIKHKNRTIKKLVISNIASVALIVLIIL